MTEFPRKIEPVLNEAHLRKYLHNKKEKTAKERELVDKDETQRLSMMKELEKDSGTKTTGADGEDLYLKRISDGSFTFDFQGRPFCMKRGDPDNLPEIEI